MRGRSPVALFAVLAATSLLGCATSAVSRGAEFYQQGRHIDADLVFEHGESQLSQLEVGERARFALYRGANYLVLGDQPAARRWLEYGLSLGSVSAAAFSVEEQALLQRGLSAVAPRALGGPLLDSPALDSPALDSPAAVVSATIGAGLAVRAARLNR